MTCYAVILPGVSLRGFFIGLEEKNVLTYRFHLPREKSFLAVHLTAHELQLLERIVPHRTVTSGFIHKHYRITGRKMSAISHRLAKLVEGGVLYRTTLVHQPPGKSKYYYRIHTRGFEVLQKNGFLTDTEAEFYIRNQHRFNKAPTHHNAALADLVQDVEQEVAHRESSFEAWGVTSRRGDFHASFNSAPLIPDWCLENRKTIFAIELDTSSQSSQVIADKARRYSAFASQLQKELVVLFVCVDLEKADGGERIRRIASLKANMPPNQEWSANVEFFVFNRSQAINHLVQRLNGPKEVEGDMVDQWFQGSKQCLGEEMVFEKSTHAVFDSLLQKGSSGLNYVTKIGRPNELPQFAGILPVTEGSVKSFQQVEAALEGIRKWNEILNGRVKLNLLLVYQEEREMTEDVFGFASPYTFFAISLDLLRLKKGSGTYPLLLERKTAFTSEMARPPWE